MLRSLIRAPGKINIHLILCGRGCTSNCSYAGSQRLRRSHIILYGKEKLLKYVFDSVIDSLILTFFFFFFFKTALCRLGIVSCSSLLWMRNPIQWTLLCAVYWPSLNTQPFIFFPQSSPPLQELWSPHTRTHKRKWSPFKMSTSNSRAPEPNQTSVDHSQSRWCGRCWKMRTGLLKPSTSCCCENNRTWVS